MKFGYGYEKEFLPLNTFGRIGAYAAIVALAFALSIFVLPIAGFRFHIFQAAVFLAAFVFGPAAGALAGALSSSYTGLLVMHNPWIILGNALLGFAAGHFFRKNGALASVLCAYAIQLPYLVLSDYYLAGMQIVFLLGLVPLLLFENVGCALIAAALAKPLSAALCGKK